MGIIVQHISNPKTTRDKHPSVMGKMIFYEEWVTSLYKMIISIITSCLVVNDSLTYLNKIFINVYTL